MEYTIEESIKILIEMLTLISNDLNNKKDDQLKNDHEFTIKTIKEHIDFLKKPLTVSGDIILLYPDDKYDKGKRHVDKIKCKIFKMEYDIYAHTIIYYIELLEGEYIGKDVLLTKNSILDPLPPYNYTLIQIWKKEEEFTTYDLPPRNGIVKYARFNEHEKNIYDQKKETSDSKSNYVFKYSVIFDDGTFDLNFPQTNMKTIFKYKN
jgi:hypothetical protein